MQLPGCMRHLAIVSLLAACSGSTSTTEDGTAIKAEIEPLAGFSYSSGNVPAGAPVTINLSASAGGKLTFEAGLEPGSGRMAIDAGIQLGNVGRFGHGLGKNMTEPPSNKPGDSTVLRPGVVLTIEPSAMYDGNKIMVHEENLVVTEGKPKLLTRRAPREMPVVPC